MSDDLLNVHQLAERVGIGAPWIERRARDGLLPHLRVGRASFFSEDAVRRALRELSAIRDDLPQCVGYPLHDAAHTARVSLFDAKTLRFLARHQAIPHFIGARNLPLFDPDPLAAWIDAKAAQLGVSPASRSFREDLARALFLRANPDGVAEWDQFSSRSRDHEKAGEAQ